MNKTDSVYLKARIRGAEAFAKWSIWSRLDSSPVALYEHIMGTEMTEIELGVKGEGKSVGAWNSTNDSKIPVWQLNDDLKTSDETPRWIVDEKEFEIAKEIEMQTYASIVEKSAELSETRINSKLEIIKSFTTQIKKYCLLSLIITLKYIEQKLLKQNYDVHLFTGSSDLAKKELGRQRTYLD